MNEWDELITQAADILATKESYYKKLGELSWKIGNDYGVPALKDFADEIKSTHGITVSYKSLENYRFVYEKLKDFEIPEDISYRTMQYMASSGKPAYWVDQINKGMSSYEVYKTIREEKGLNKVRVYICKHCNKENIIS